MDPELLIGGSTNGSVNVEDFEWLCTQYLKRAAAGKLFVHCEKLAARGASHRRFPRYADDPGHGGHEDAD